MSMRQVVHLPDSRLNEAAEALSQAFHDDPLQSYTFPDPEQRRRLSPAHFSAILKYGLLAGQVFTGAEPGSGAAIWIPPGAVDTPEMAETSGLTRLPETIGVDAAGRFSRMIGYAEALHHRDMTDPHWYVMSSAWRRRFRDRATAAPCCSRCWIGPSSKGCRAISKRRNRRT